MDWSITTRRNYYKAADGTAAASGTMALCRADDDTLLGNVSCTYPVFDNHEFAELIDGVLGDTYSINRGGYWNNGKKVYIEAESDTYDIGSDDTHKSYTVFTTDHTGNGSVTVTPRTERMYCTNQLASISHRGFSVAHRGNMAANISRLRDVLLGLESWQVETRNTYAGLAESAIESSWLQRFFQRAYLETCTPNTRGLLSMDYSELDTPAQSKYENAVAKMARRVESYAGNYSQCEIEGGGLYVPSDIRGTRYHAFNAVTSDIDHSGRYNAHSVKLGAANNLKNKVLELATTLDI
jgi:hypothetical protein